MPKQFDDEDRGCSRRHAVAALCLAALVPACSGLQNRPADAEPALPRQLADAPLLLLGEMHDHPDAHRLRLHWLEDMARNGAPRVLAMEQFDSPMQQRLAKAQARFESSYPRMEPPSQQVLLVAARELAEAAAFRFEGWDWTYYAPVVALALRHRWPLVAANLPARDAMAAVRAAGARGVERPAGWNASDEAAMSEEIRHGHCDLLPAAQIPAMTAMQIVRDQAMADAMLQARRDTGLAVILLAGNGHVRCDLGVPRHLPRARVGEQKVAAVGIVEPGAAVAGRYDFHATVPAWPRGDSCEPLRRRLGSPARPKVSARLLPAASRALSERASAQSQHVLHVEQATFAGGQKAAGT